MIIVIFSNCIFVVSVSGTYSFLLNSNAVVSVLLGMIPSSYNNYCSLGKFSGDPLNLFTINYTYTYIYLQLQEYIIMLH